MGTSTESPDDPKNPLQGSAFRSLETDITHDDSEFGGSPRPASPPASKQRTPGSPGQVRFGATPEKRDLQEDHASGHGAKDQSPADSPSPRRSGRRRGPSVRSDSPRNKKTSQKPLGTEALAQETSLAAQRFARPKNWVLDWVRTHHSKLLANLEISATAKSRLESRAVLVNMVKTPPPTTRAAKLLAIEAPRGRVVDRKMEELLVERQRGAVFAVQKAATALNKMIAPGAEALPSTISSGLEYFVGVHGAGEGRTKPPVFPVTSAAAVEGMLHPVGGEIFGRNSKFDF